MLHGLKLVMNGRGDRTVLDSDARLRDADKVISELQRWFPQLQVAVEENEKTWATLGYNLRTVSATSQEIYSESHAMQPMLEALLGAGKQVMPPAAGDRLAEERTQSFAELRAFNDAIRELRTLQSECVGALKNKDYYANKVETMRVNESKKKKVTERDVEKRLRNEQKLNEVTSELSYKTDKLQRELDAATERKESVLNLTLHAFIHTQNHYFGRNPMPHVVAALPRRSPTSVHAALPMHTFAPPPPSAPPPPRAPSPAYPTLA